MIEIRAQDFQKVAIVLTPFFRKLVRTASTGTLEKKVVKNRIESYLQSKSGVTGDNSRQKRRYRVST